MSEHNLLMSAEFPLSLSIVIPTLNEARNIARLLNALNPLQDLGAELILVDGGSRDETVGLARLRVDQVLEPSKERPLKGRARQMNAGAAAAKGQWLWFVHADSGVSQPVIEQLIAHIQSGQGWARFNVTIEGDSVWFPVIAGMMNRRSCWTGLATGDQGILVRRQVFEAVGCYPLIPLMEDIEISRRLGRSRKPVCLTGPLVTSGRRWEAQGVFRTVAMMWFLRFAWWLGADAAWLARLYR